VNVGNLLLVVLPSVRTRVFTLEKGLMNAVNVGNLLSVIMVLDTIAIFTLQERFKIAQKVILPCLV